MEHVSYFVIVIWSLGKYQPHTEHHREYVFDWDWDVWLCLKLLDTDIHFCYLKDAFNITITIYNIICFQMGRNNQLVLVRSHVSIP